MNGERFGRLVVLEVLKSEGRGVLCLCICDCGKQSTKQRFRLRDGTTRSCGCLKRDANLAAAKGTHGMTGTAVYRAWKHMIARCENPNDNRWSSHGKRGIRVCKRWRKSFVAFQNDMGPRPDKMSLDRINNDKGYSPMNCRWATSREQAMNRRSNHFLFFNGVKKTVKEWASETGIKEETLRARVLYSKWSHEKALTMPVKKRTSPGSLKPNHRIRAWLIAR